MNHVQASIAIPVEQSAFPQVSTLYDLLSRRAFELFRTRGADGSDLDEWFHPESELFHVTHIDLAESPDTLLVRAELPGFTFHELEIGIGPRCLTIAGKRSLRDRLANHRVIYHDSCSDQLFRVLGLPMEVDPSSRRQLPPASLTCGTARRRYSAR